MEKSGAAFTESVTVVECVSAPLVPVRVRVALPDGVVPVVLIVRVEVPELVTDGGLNEAVATAGRPLALRVTVPVKLLMAAIVVV